MFFSHSYSLRSLEAPLAISLLDPDRKLTAAGGGTHSNDNEDSNEGAEASEQEEKTALELGEYETKAEVSLAQSQAEVEMGSPLGAKELLAVHLSLHDMRRLELYARNMVDHHMILDTVPTLATLVFQGRLPSIRLSYLQVAALTGPISVPFLTMCYYLIRWRFFWQ